jgi:hypothetical protein
MAGLAGCGGGGGDAAPPPWSGVTIEVPTDADTFRTGQPQLALQGRAFVPDGSTCNAIGGTIAPGYQVRWSNAATGESGDAGLQLNCLLQVSLTWEVAPVALLGGANVVTVTATAADGRTGVDSIVITRTP